MCVESCVVDNIHTSMDYCGIEIMVYIAICVCLVQTNKHCYSIDFTSCWYKTRLYIHASFKNFHLIQT